MISVIIPARNAAGTIGATMASLVGDRARILEILLIDDGSDDDTVSNAEQVAKGLDRRRVRRLHLFQRQVRRRIGIGPSEYCHLTVGGVIAIRADQQSVLAIRRECHELLRF